MTPKYDEDGRGHYHESNVLENTPEEPQPEEGSQFRDGASGTERVDKTIIAVGGAKGGVGKSEYQPFLNC